MRVVCCKLKWYFTVKSIYDADGCRALITCVGITRRWFNEKYYAINGWAFKRRHHWHFIDFSVERQAASMSQLHSFDIRKTYLSLICAAFAYGRRHTLIRHTNHIAMNTNTINIIINFSEAWARRAPCIYERKCDKNWGFGQNRLLFILSSGFNFAVRDVDVDDRKRLDKMTVCHLTCAQPTAKSYTFHRHRGRCLQFSRDFSRIFFNVNRKCGKKYKNKNK